MKHTFTVKKLPAEPIVLCQMLPDYDAKRDIDDSDSAQRAFLSQTDEPLFFITDVSNVAIDFTDIMMTANRGARGDNAPWHHPMTREKIFVSPLPAVKMAAEGLNSPAFGMANVKVFATLDEALTFCREQIAIQAK
ncbi:MAG TPA: hypothetical protein VHP83_03270 [Aggregatilineaceae bacterium]|nr:hypothetical protein [Aggregatilineaceae bacterium]